MNLVVVPKRLQELINEDITEEVDDVSSKTSGTSSLRDSQKQLHETSAPSRVQNKSDADNAATNSEYLRKLRDDLDAVMYLRSSGLHCLVGSEKADLSLFLYGTNRKT